MDRLTQMQIFVTVAEEQGFAAAARRLQQSAPAVTRAVAGLEAHLGVKLLNRTTRYVRATEAGERYLDDARRILAEVEAAEEAAAGVNAEPRGTLHVTAPVLFGRKYVLPGIVERRRANHSARWSGTSSTRPYAVSTAAPSVATSTRARLRCRTSGRSFFRSASRSTLVGRSVGPVIGRFHS